MDSASLIPFVYVFRFGPMPAGTRTGSTVRKSSWPSTARSRTTDSNLPSSDPSSKVAVVAPLLRPRPCGGSLHQIRSYPLQCQASNSIQSSTGRPPPPPPPPRSRTVRQYRCFRPRQLRRRYRRQLPPIPPPNDLQIDDAAGLGSECVVKKMCRAQSLGTCGELLNRSSCRTPSLQSR